jgi:c-di-GMP-related signal transduction protein
MSGIGSDKPIELMSAAVIRARLCELIAREFKLQDQPADLFLKGQARNILKLVRAFEKADWEAFSLFSHNLGLDEEKLAVLYLEAVEWARFLSTHE